MTENKTKIIDLDNNDKDKFLSQFKKNKKKSDVVDTGKVHDVLTESAQDHQNGFTALWGNEFKKKYKNPIKRLYKVINDEELNDNESETLVRIFGIISGLIVILAIVAIIGVYYFTYSSYSASYRRAVAAEGVGNYEQALRLYEKALTKTSNTEKRIDVLNNLVRLSEEQETDLNVKSYLLELVKEDPGNTENILKLKQLYIDSEDIDAIFNLADAVKDHKNSEMLYDIILNQPVFNYKSGTYDEPISLTLTSDEGCSIYYTTDGSEANENSTPYTGAIPINNTGITVIHAISINSDGIKSKDYSETYEIISDTLEVPSVFPASGTYADETEIVITIPEGYEAYYTLDGSEPNSSSMVYEKGMTIPYGNHVFSVKFIGSNGYESETVSRVYIFEPDYEISLNEAVYLLKKELLDSKIIYESGDVFYYLNNNAACDFQCTNIIGLNDELFYLINITDTYGGESKYTVHVNNGAVFKLNQDQYDSYYLAAIE